MGSSALLIANRKHLAVAHIRARRLAFVEWVSETIRSLRALLLGNNFEAMP